MSLQSSDSCPRTQVGIKPCADETSTMPLAASRSVRNIILPCALASAWSVEAIAADIGDHGGPSCVVAHQAMKQIPGREIPAQPFLDFFAPAGRRGQSSSTDRTSTQDERSSESNPDGSRGTEVRQRTRGRTAKLGRRRRLAISPEGQSLSFGRERTNGV